jgi:CDGSH iron-sulfur domain-containing protein 3
MEIPSSAEVTAGTEVRVEAGRTYWWCACGLSKTQPFCDGSHKGTSISPLKYCPAESGIQRLCVCKRTTTPPLCDGAHYCL